MLEGGARRAPKGNIKFSIKLSDEQKLAKQTILENPFNFILGEAGTGKTLLAIQIALDKLFKKDVDKIIITRPTVSSEKNGFLPGSLEEKMEPWLVPIIDNMNKVYNRDNGSSISKLILDNKIEIVSLTHFRGRTFSNAVCVIDEFQNLTIEQLGMCLGRLGKKSIMMFCGDDHQIDLRPKIYSSVNKLKALEDSEYVNIIKLTENHRHESLKDVLKHFYKV